MSDIKAIKLDIELRANEDEWATFKRSKIWQDMNELFEDWKMEAHHSLADIDSNREDDLIAKSRIQTLDQVLGIVDIIIEAIQLEKEEEDEREE